MNPRIIVPEEMAKGYTRREFLKLLERAGISVTVGTTVFLAGCKRKVNPLAGAREVITRCGICSADCGMNAYIKNDRVIAVAPWPEDPDTKGFMCDMGLATVELLYAPDRILNPKKRVGTAWTDITWDEAMDSIARKLIELKKDLGPQSLICHYGVSQVRSMFFRYLQRRFCNVYGTPNFTGCGSQCAVATMLARKYSTGPISPDYENAKCIVLWGCNPSVSAPLGWVHRILPAKGRGAKLICIDPRPNLTTKVADIHLRPRPGSDGALALSMMQVIVNDHLYEEDFIEKHCVGFSELKALVDGYKPEVAENITGIPAEDIRKAARTYATHSPACIEPGSALELHINGVQTIRAVMLLQALTGNIDVKGGALMEGDKTPLVDLELKAHSKVVSTGISSNTYPLFWESRKMVTANVIPEAILSGKPYPIKSLIVVGGNPVVTGPNAAHQRRAYKQLDLMVVMDLFMTETAKMADIFLPAASFLERDNLKVRDRIYMTPKVIPERGEAWPEWKFWFELAKRMGYTREFPWATLDEAIDEHLSPIQVTSSHLRQNFHGVDYQARSGYKKYEKDGFRTHSRKIEFYSQALADAGYDPLPRYVDPYKVFAEKGLNARYPLIMTSGARIPYYFHSQFRNLPSLRAKFPDPLLEINPSDASALGIREGDTVNVISPRGGIRAKATIIQALKVGTVAMSHGWAEANINELTDDAFLDPISGFPEYRGFMCRVEKV